MKQTVYIHTNNNQKLGAIVAKHAIESRLTPLSPTTVEFINVDALEIFSSFVGTEYIFSGSEKRVYRDNDLQSFTLARFMPPALMGYEGKAIVIDPDIFALSDIDILFSLDLGMHALAVCRKKDAWDTSVMLMDCHKLHHWTMTDILNGLTQHTLNYTDIMTLRNETASILELSRTWNQLDEYTKDTHMIHMTNRLTQPWKTGLPINFTRNAMPKFLGIIPRELIHTLLRKNYSHYQPHPNPTIEKLFFTLTAEAIRDGAVTEKEIRYEIEKRHVRPDILDLIPTI